jgi:kynureninase
VPSRAEAEARDEVDPLRAVREEFVIEAAGPIYLDGNSLGRLPRKTVDELQTAVEEGWGKGLVRSWSRWVDLPATLGDLIGAEIVGAAAGQIVVADSTTINLYKAAAAALAARPDRSAVLTDAGNFPTDRYVLEGLCRERNRELRFLTPDPVDGVQAAEVEAATAGGDVALVLLSHVDYRSAALGDLAGITATAHRAGALVVWDLSHSAGAVPVDLDASGADLAVGCTYKYLNGGPGAPAFVYVRAEHQVSLSQPVWGWFGQRDQFDMGPRYDPVRGIGSWLSGTPPVLGLVAAAAGVAGVAAVGVGALRARSVALTDLIVELADDWLAPLGAAVASPRVGARRGGHVAIRHPEAWRVCQALIDRYDVIPDFRPPDVVRLGPSPMYTRFAEVWDALDRIREALASGAWMAYPEARRRVT